MTQYGVTAAGFVRKRLDTIKAEMEADYRSVYGDGIDLSATSPFGQQIGIHAEREDKLWELAEDVYLSAYPDTAEGVSLDNAVAYTGTTRADETHSKAVITAFGETGTVIPQGSVVSVYGSPDSRFATDNDAVLAAGTDAVQHIGFSGVPASGAWTLTYSGQTTTSLAFDADAVAVQAALRALPNLGNGVVVAGNYTSGFDVTFAGDDDGEMPQPLMTSTDSLETSAPAAITITIATTTTGVLPQADIGVTAEEAGAIQAPGATLTVIETPVLGWDSVTNVESAEVGNAVESDPDLKIRRKRSLQRSGAGTVEAIRSKLLEVAGVDDALVMENATDTAVSGQPPHSLACTVQGGEDAAVALEIWRIKGGGIQTHGSEEETITDSMGFEQVIKFSRPAAVPIWVEIDVTPNTDVAEGEVYPDDGDDLVVGAVLEYGSGLGLGGNVIVYPKLVAALNAVPGIIDLAIRVGTAENPTLDDNVAIGATEISTWSADRIVVDSTP